MQDQSTGFNIFIPVVLISRFSFNPKLQVAPAWSAGLKHTVEDFITGVQVDVYSLTQNLQVGPSFYARSKYTVQNCISVVQVHEYFLNLKL